MSRDVVLLNESSRESPRQRYEHLTESLNPRAERGAFTVALRCENAAWRKHPGILTEFLISTARAQIVVCGCAF
jgi:hypothetical protein